MKRGLDHIVHSYPLYRRRKIDTDWIGGHQCVLVTKLPMYFNGQLFVVRRRRGEAIMAQEGLCHPGGGPPWGEDH
eukprot:365917-Chlamydomonas_euryale.AAC.13